LYPTDNENQNIEEANNKNIDINEPLDPKQLKKQQKALKKAQKEEEKRRGVSKESPQVFVQPLPMLKK